MELKIKVMEHDGKDQDLENEKELIVQVGKGLRWMLDTESIETVGSVNIETIESNESRGDITEKDHAVENEIIEDLQMKNIMKIEKGINVMSVIG